MRISHGPFVMNVHLVLAACAIALLLVQCSSKGPTPLALHNLESLNALLSHELASHRVVMLGDAQPGLRSYSDVVISYLQYWLNQQQRSQADTSLPRHLLLVLELSPSGAAELNRFLETGDRAFLLRALIDEQAKFGYDVNLTRELSVDYVRFCEQLRQLLQSVDSLKRQDPAHAPFLDVTGFEPDPPYNYSDLHTKDRQEVNYLKAHWDRTGRDAESAAGLVRQLSQHPEQKALWFTSAIHTDRDASEGSFAARILDSLMGRASVSVFQMRRTPRSPASGPQIEEFRHDVGSPDFLVRKRPAPPHPIPFFVVKTQNTFHAMIDLSEQYSTSADTLEVDLSRKLLSHTLDLLRRSHLGLEPVTGQRIASLQAAVAAATRRAVLSPGSFPRLRHIVSRFDAVKDVISIDSVMITFTPTQDLYNDLTALIDNLPVNAVRIPDTLVVTTADYVPGDSVTARWARSWKAHRSEIRTTMLSQILWLGTPSEVTRALMALGKETGEAFRDVAECDAWLRQH